MALADQRASVISRRAPTLGSGYAPAPGSLYSQGCRGSGTTLLSCGWPIRSWPWKGTQCPASGTVQSYARPPAAPRHGTRSRKGRRSGEKLIDKDNQNYIKEIEMSLVLSFGLFWYHLSANMKSSNSSKSEVLANGGLIHDIKLRWWWQRLSRTSSNKRITDEDTPKKRSTDEWRLKEKRKSSTCVG